MAAAEAAPRGVLLPMPGQRQVAAHLPRRREQTGASGRRMLQRMVTRSKQSGRLSPPPFPVSAPRGGRPDGRQVLAVCPAGSRLSSKSRNRCSRQSSRQRGTSRRGHNGSRSQRGPLRMAARQLRGRTPGWGQRCDCCADGSVQHAGAAAQQATERQQQRPRWAGQQRGARMPGSPAAAAGVALCPTPGRLSGALQGQQPARRQQRSGVGRRSRGRRTAAAGSACGGSSRTCSSRRRPRRGPAAPGTMRSSRQSCGGGGAGGGGVEQTRRTRRLVPAAPAMPQGTGLAERRRQAASQVQATSTWTQAMTRTTRLAGSRASRGGVQTSARSTSRE